MRLYRRLLHPWVLTTIALVVLVLLVWFFGPLIAFGDWRPLDGSWARALVIVLILLVPAAVLLFKLWRRRRKSDKLVEAVTAGPSAAEREGQVLQQRFKEALQILDDSARKTGRRSLTRRGQHLYDLPWYMFIGAPGSGKTTALMNAGLTFPLAGKLGQASVRGIGGTRNCEWWFTEEAVLIDTAGRYALQQSDETTDASAWKTFLSLLRKARPRRPINGVLLTVNVQDLLQQSPADRKEHALRLRTRLQELHQQLGVRPPVYVLVTKCDLLAGFNETFENLGREDREQVWGFSFPHDEEAAARATPMRAFGAEFDALEQRLREQLIERMQSESDVLRRAAIFAFPPQFAGIKGLLGGFLEQVFEGGAGLEEAALVRGVYFTSGTQEGSPIDRVLGTLGRTFGVDGRATAAPGARGKAFFLTRLLKDVIFHEQGLVGTNRQQERRRRTWRLATAGAIGVAVVAVVGGWTASFLRNQSYIDQVEARLPELKTAVAELPPATSAELSLLPQVLDRAAALPQPDGFEIEAPPLLNTLGLYEGEHVAAGADIAYRRLLDKALLPRVTRRLEERLRAVDRNNLELAYESLKHYLMLYTPEHFDADSLAAFVGLDWDANLAGTLGAEQRQALGRHLLAAFQHGAPPPASPMDEALVANVREMLAVYPLEFRIFSRLQRARIGADIPEFTVAGAAGPNALRVFERASGQPLTNGIPGLFTRDGYLKAFRSAQARVSKALADEQGWVMGRGAGNSAVASGQAAAQAAGAAIGVSTDELDQKVRRLYLQEYIKRWDSYLDDVRLVRLDGLGTSRTVAGLLAAPDSPLKAYLIAVTRETQLEQAVQAEGAGKLAQAAAAVQVERAKQEMEMMLGVRPTAGDNKGTGRPLEAMVDDHFAHIHRLVAGQPPPIDDVLKLFNEVFVQLTAIDAAQKSRTAPPPGGGGAAAKAAAALQPEPIKSMLETLADAGASQGRSAERQGLTADLKPVADLCARTVAGRYPFAKGSRADVMPDDFGQIFGVGGQLDAFYNERLASLVDTGSATWTFRPLPDGSKPPGGAALADFQRAARIREAFFRAGGKTPGFKVDLRMVEMAEGLPEVVIDVDGQAMRFVAGDTAPQTFTWPSARIASQIRLSGGPGSTPRSFEGPWALFRLIDQFEVQPSTQPERFTVVLNIDGRRARMEVISSSALNPLRLRELQTFRCPQTL